jgi:AraC-like DNA-binding protein
MDRLQFSLQDVLSVLGLAQCLLILVYMLFRAGGLTRALVPIAYFLVLGLAFLADLAARFVGQAFEIYPVLQWILWFSGPPLSFLLILQIARLSAPPSLRAFALLLLVPAALAGAILGVWADGSCGGESLARCESFARWLRVTGLAAGAVGLLAVWGVRGLMEGVRLQKMGDERFWLILALVGINGLFLGLVLAQLSGMVEGAQVDLIRTVLGMGSAYVAGTSLFRIYPLAVRMAADAVQELTEPERHMARRVEGLLDLDKVYHEPSYSRSDLARELGVPEASVSRIVNLHFGRSVIQLLNERRVEDAKRLLTQTDAPVRTVAVESGFNSLASFNRVFKEIAGCPPGTYRASSRTAVKAS